VLVIQASGRIARKFTDGFDHLCSAIIAIDFLAINVKSRERKNASTGRLGCFGDVT